VTDTGMGVAPQDLPSLFSRFWQADSSSRRKSQGVGIGLALSELITAHGGSVSADSAPGRGTTMTVWLPRGPSQPADAGTGQAVAAPAREATPAPPAGEAATEAEWLSDLYRRRTLRERDSVAATDSPLPTSERGSKPQVLVVDDEPDMLRFLQMLLSTDYEVIEGGRRSGGHLASQYLPDVIVCDLMLPEKDGLAVCRELRSQTSTRGCRC
jgi:CheY-like chemotaxis protein